MTIFGGSSLIFDSCLELIFGTKIIFIETHLIITIFVLHLRVNSEIYFSVVREYEFGASACIQKSVLRQHSELHLRHTNIAADMLN